MASPRRAAEEERRAQREARRRRRDSQVWQSAMARRGWPSQEAGSSAVNAPPPPPPPPPPPANQLTEAEARELVRTNTPVPANCVLPEGWATNPVHVPVAPMLAGQARLDYVASCMGTMAPELHDDPRFEPNSAYWDKQVELEHAYRLHSFFAPKPPADWLEDSDDDGLTNTTDEDFAAGMERERVRYEAVEQARRARSEGGRVQPPPPQPQQEAEEVDGDDDGLEDWPPTPEWDPGHMQLAIEADIASAAATASAATTSSSAATTSTTGYLYCLCSSCRRGPVLAAARAGACPNCRCPACHPTY